MAMNPGALRDRVSIQTRVTSNQPMGVSEEWSDLGDVDASPKKWCAVAPLNARLRTQWQQQNVNVSHKVVFRGGLQLDPQTQRLYWHGTRNAAMPILTLVSVDRYVDGAPDFVVYFVQQSAEGAADVNAGGTS